LALHRRAAKRDDNEVEIVTALRRVGADVRRLSGAGVPDLLVGFRCRTLLLGVKRPDGPRGGTSAGRDRKSGDQRPDAWPGGPWVVVTTVAEALEVLGFMAEAA
jgi:hypothetical protein